MDVQTEKSWRFKRRPWWHKIGLDYLFQKIAIIKKVQAGEAFENSALLYMHWFDFMNFIYLNYIAEKLLVTYL
jgi:hypothetical protein